MDIIKHIDKICSDIPEAIKQLSPHGHGERIKKNKPKNGFYAYVWRMIRFDIGVDTTLPMCAHFNIIYEVERLTGEKLLFGILTKREEEILDKLDSLVYEVEKAMDLPKNIGARNCQHLYS